MRWKNISERTINANRWFKLNVADVELPNGRHIDHYLLRMPPVTLTAILNKSEEVLLLWRHRFIPDSWGWELPSGIVEEGETLEESAIRETLEETGWRPAQLQYLATLETSGGFSDARHHVYWTDRAEYTGPPVDSLESDRVEWIKLRDIPELISKGQIPAANMVAALLMLHHQRKL